MRIVAVLLALAACTHAWTTSSLSMMGSRQATKWDRKKAWLEKRSGSSEKEVVSSASSSFTAEIIGSGRIGAFLAQAGDCSVMGRNDNIDPDKEGQPILIATRNDALEGIVEKCPTNRRKDLVFLQNGYLDNFLASKGLIDNTQVLLYLSVPSKGAMPIDGVTTVNPEGLTASNGIHAQAFADRLASLNMKCNVVSPQDYRPAMFEKLM
jgi:hypothetical protein